MKRLVLLLFLVSIAFCVWGQGGSYNGIPYRRVNLTLSKNVNQNIPGQVEAIGTAPEFIADVRNSRCFGYAKDDIAMGTSGTLYKFLGV